MNVCLLCGVAMHGEGFLCSLFFFFSFFNIRNDVRCNLTLSRSLAKDPAFFFLSIFLVPCTVIK